jgi:hypothetical protein
MNVVALGVPPLTLDQRIADLLRPDAEQPTSSVFADLLTEVDTAIDEADQLGREMRAKSIDPSVADGIAARGAAEDSEFKAARLRNGEARLKELHAAAVAREVHAEWCKNADEVGVYANQLAIQLREKYPLLIAEIIKLFGWIVEADRAIDALNRSAPPGEGLRLRHVEQIARGIEDGFRNTDTKILERCVLPEFVPGHGTCKELWPPAQPNLSLQIFAQTRAMMQGVSGWPPTREQILADPDRRAEDSQRHADAGRARELERQRLNAEREARARDYALEQRLLRAGEVPH